jgi:hypothetical protein
MKGAVFTIVKNEAYFLPIWIRYYRKFFEPEDIYVIDTGSDDGSISGESNDYVLVRHDSIYSFDVKWLLERVMQFQQKLLGQWKYDFVLFAEADEIVVPDSGHDFASHVASHNAVRCLGMEVLHLNEPPIDWSLPLLSQRKFWANIQQFNKPLLSKVPLNWEYGFHDSMPSYQIDPTLTMIHLRRIDFRSCRLRLSERRMWPRPPEQARNMAWQWKLQDNEFASWFMEPFGYATEIPEKFKDAV